MSLKMKTAKIVLLLVLAADILHAQTYELGGGVQVFRLKGNILETYQGTNYNGPTTTLKNIFRITPALDIEGALNFPFYEREKFAIGIQPALTGNLMWIPGNFLFSGTRGDLFLTCRFGPEASYANYADDKLFFGFGAGYSLFEIVDIDYDFSDKFVFLNPSLFFETGENEKKLKFYFLLNSHETHYNGYTGSIPKLNYWEFGISFVKWGFFNKEN
jgi:hypothetical protein